MTGLGNINLGLVSLSVVLRDVTGCESKEVSR